MAAGFAESYVRLWSLNGEKLRGLRNDIPSHVKDCKSIVVAHVQRHLISLSAAGLKRAK